MRSGNFVCLKDTRCMTPHFQSTGFSAHYERGVITVTALLVLSSSVVVYLALQSAFMSHKSLQGKYAALQEEERVLKNISADLMPRLVKSGRVPPWFAKQHANYEIKVEDHSGRIHIAFVHPFWFDSAVLRLLFENEEEFEKFFNLRKTAGVMGDYAAYLTEKTRGFLTRYALVNVNADDFDAIKKLLTLNGVEEAVAEGFWSELVDKRAREDYLEPKDLESLFKVHEVPRVLMRLFVAEPLVNINAVSMEILQDLLKNEAFEITNVEQTLDFIKNKRKGSTLITIKDMRKNITTYLDDQFFFKIFTDRSSVYKTAVCGKALCHTQVLMRMYKDTERELTKENTFWQVVEDKVGRK